MEVASHCELLCDHCQLPIPPEVHGRFCCAGCEAVHSLLHDKGLDDFYRMRGLTRLRPVQESSMTEEGWDSAVRSRPDGTQFLELRISGITCSACVWLIERVPIVAPDILRAQVDLEYQTVRVVFSPSVSVQRVLDVFRRLGYGVEPLLPEERKGLTYERVETRRSVMRVAVGFASMMSNMHLSLTLYGGLFSFMPDLIIKNLGWTSVIVSLPGVFYSAWPFYQNAWAALRVRRLNLDFLVSCSIGVGFFASIYQILQGRNEIYLDSVTMLICFLLLGRLVVRMSERRWLSRRSFFWEGSGQFRNLRVDQEVTVRSNEAFPCDGVVVSGQSQMNAAWLTGEVSWVPVRPGSEVWSGAVNVGQAVQVRVQKLGEGTRAGQILRSLSGVRRSRFVLLSERLELAFTLAILLGTLAWGVWRVGIQGDPSGFSEVVALIMVSCPCALGLAVPSVLATANRQAAENGIIVREGDLYERLQEIQMLVLDKTGTLTEPNLSVAKFQFFDEQLRTLGLSQAEVGDWLRVLSESSGHVLLKSLRRGSTHLEDTDFLSPTRDKLPPVSPHSIVKESIAETLGEGLEARTHSGFEIRLGRRTFCQAQSDLDLIEANASETGNGPAMELWVWDPKSGVRTSLLVVEFYARARNGLRELMSNWLKRFEIRLASGDTHKSVTSFASGQGIPMECCHSDLSPERKLSFVEAWVQNWRVLMVGDGVNDLLAMKKAHVAIGIAGGLGGLESCDAYLVRGDLRQIDELLGAAKKVSQAILTNFIWVVIYNLIGITLVLKGAIGPVVCAILMPASSVWVLLLASLRRYFKRESPWAFS